jgi:uncharacterized iron-regulated protein
MTLKHLKMYLLKYFMLCTLFLGVTLTSFGQLSEKNYRIYSVKEGKEVTLRQIADDMENYDVLFFGEEHNDSVTHYLEHHMLELLFENYAGRVVLSMEMFDRDVQGIMDEYLFDGIREKSFTKDARAWSNYRDYKPMVEFAKKNKLDVICANAPTRYTNLAGRLGMDALAKLSPGSLRNFAPLPYDTATGAYYEKLMGLMGHTATPAKDTSAKPAAPMAAMGGFNMILSQSLWDATMAYSIAEYLHKFKDVKVMQVNGRFHSDEGYAAVAQLKNYDAHLKPLIVSTGSDESFPNINWEQYKNLGDYIIITDPAVPKTYND